VRVGLWEKEEAGTIVGCHPADASAIKTSERVREMCSFLQSVFIVLIGHASIGNENTRFRPGHAKHGSIDIRDMRSVETNFRNGFFLRLFEKD
jgi:hypothetical protein